MIPDAQPPPSFQPQLPPLSVPSPAAAAAPPTPQQPDLITRYNLASKVSSREASNGSSPADEGAPASASSWSDNKGERQELLKKRREEMILRARRKMEEKERQEAQ